MCYIKTVSPAPGIVGLMQTQPWTAVAQNQLAQTLLREKPEVLEPWVREYIAAETSKMNRTRFCEYSHRAASLALSGESDRESLEAKSKPYEPLLALARSVARYNADDSGSTATNEEDIKWAQESGFTDEQIQLTVAIAAAFCMFNRYVQCLGTQCPEEFEAYIGMGQMLASVGYVHAIETVEAQQAELDHEPAN